MSAGERQAARVTSAPAWCAYGWWIGAVAGLVAGLGAGVLAQDLQEWRETADVASRAEAFERGDPVPPPGDAVRALVAQDTLVAVDPLLAGRIPEADLRRAEAVLATAPVPARIAFLRDPSGVDEGYTASGAAAQWRVAVGERGHYVVLFDNGSTESGAVELEGHYVNTRSKGQPGPALVRVAEEMVTWQGEPLPTAPETAFSGEDYWGGIGGGIGAAGVIGSLAVVPPFLLLRLYVGSRRRKET